MTVLRASLGLLVVAFTGLVAGPAAGQTPNTQPGESGNPEEGTWLVPVLLGGAILVAAALVLFTWSRRGSRNRRDQPRPR